MVREIFIVKNISGSEIELKDFGLLIPSGVTVDLSDFDQATISDELYNYMLIGDIIRVVDGIEVEDITKSYDTTTQYYGVSSTFNNVIQVAKTGTTYDTINSALASITDNASDNRYLIEISPEVYVEDVTLKPFVSIGGVSRYSRIEGKITASYTGITSVSSLSNLELRTFNEESINVNIGGSLSIEAVNIKTYYTTVTGQAIKASIIISDGVVSVNGDSNIILYNTNGGTVANNNETIYHVNSSNDVTLSAINSIYSIVSYEQNNTVSIVYNDNTNTDTTINVKESTVKNYLYNAIPSNTIIPVIHNTASNTTILSNVQFFLDVTSASATGVTLIGAYNTNSVTKSVINYNYNSFGWFVPNITNDQIYIGGATNVEDEVKMVNCIINTTADFIPPIYTVGGSAGSVIFSLTNAQGTSVVEKTLTDTLQIGNTTSVTKILDENNLGSDDPNALATQKSIKYYVDSQIGSSGVTQQEFDTYTGTTAPNTYIPIVTGATENNVPIFTTDGKIQDSGYNISQLTGGTSGGVTQEEFNTYTGTTAPNTFVDIDDFETYTGNTETEITSLSTALSSEISSTDSDITSLSTTVSTETSDRTSADTSLSTAISSTDSDVTSLSTTLSNEISSTDSDVTSLSTEISTETSTRSSADTSLSTGLSTEISTRSSADTSLSTEISTETSDRTSADISLSTALSTETSTRTSADTSLSSALSTEISSTNSDVTSLSSEISTETSDRILGDTSLSTALSNEISSIDSDVTSLSTAISSNDSDVISLSTAVSTNESGITSLTTDFEIYTGTTAPNTYQTIITGAATTITDSNLSPNQVVVSNSSGKIALANVTTTEVNYVGGVTSAIQTQLNSKEPTITGAATTITGSNLTINRAVISDGSGKVAISPTTSTQIEYLSGVTSDVQIQINSKQGTITGGASTITTDNLTINRALISDGSGKVVVSPTTSIELSYVNGVTSDIQSQLNDKAPLNSPSLTGIPIAPTATQDTNTTQLATTAFVLGQASIINPLMNGNVSVGTSLRYSREDHIHASDTSKIDIVSGATLSNIATLLANGHIQDSGKQFDITVSPSGVATDDNIPTEKAVRTAIDQASVASIVLQGEWDAYNNVPDLTVSGITTGYAWVVSASGNTVLDGKSPWFVGDLAIKAETGWIQISNQDIFGTAVWGSIYGTLTNQNDLKLALDAKQDLITGAATTITDSNLAFNRALASDALGKVVVSTTTSTELSYLSGITSNIQSQIDSKEPTITGAATTITNSNLTINRALISDGSGKVAVSTVTSTALGYIHDLTSDVQAQINTKSPLISPAFTGIPTAPTASQDTSTTQIATTAFVLNQASITDPLMNGSTSVGTSLRYSRGDHIHPTDTTLIPKVSGITEGNVAIWRPDGTIYDSGVAIGSVTGGTGYYLYADKQTQQTTTASVDVLYLSVADTLSGGIWSLDYNAIGGNTQANKYIGVSWHIDGVQVGTDNVFKTNDSGAIVPFVLTVDVELTSGYHYFEIFFYASQGGTAFLDYGAIRARIVQ